MSGQGVSNVYQSPRKAISAFSRPRPNLLLEDSVTGRPPPAWAPRRGTRSPSISSFGLGNLPRQDCHTPPRGAVAVLGLTSGRRGILHDIHFGLVGAVSLRIGAQSYVVPTGLLQGWYPANAARERLERASRGPPRSGAGWPCSKLSGWLNAFAACRVERRACGARRGVAREA